MEDIVSMVVCKFMFENFSPTFFGSKIAVKYIAIKLNRFFLRIANVEGW